ncbi:MAG: hypothetical protein DI535_17685 [Citrobacter freundii]|nr:MAG: hypothetical protein DI535_17685 [Citrobacter freundii]
MLVFDGDYYSEGAAEFLRTLHELSPFLLTGVFLPPVKVLNSWGYTEGTGVTPVAPLLQPGELEAIEKNISCFEHFCQHNGIEYRVHREFENFSINGFENESRFSDLIVLGSELFYKNLQLHLRNDYLRDVLHRAESPVMLVPETFNFPNHIILGYDGSEDAVFAIKQFAYILPELAGLEATVVYADKDRESAIPEKDQVEELVARHFINLSFQKVHMSAARYTEAWIPEERSSMLVCGAYNRSFISQLFKKSFAKDIIADHQIPVFIAHK